MDRVLLEFYQFSLVFVYFVCVLEDRFVQFIVEVFGQMELCILMVGGELKLEVQVCGVNVEIVSSVWCLVLCEFDVFEFGEIDYVEEEVLFVFGGSVVYGVNGDGVEVDIVVECLEEV